MDIIDNIVHYFQSDKKKEDNASPEGTCPVCWGFQEYDGKIRTLLKDRQKDINNHEDSYMIIQDFMKHNIDEIKLKESIVTDCPNCSTKKEKQMTIKKIKEALKTSSNPVMQSLHSGIGFKVLVMGFKKGMILKKHESDIRAKLTVLEGAVSYKEEHRVVELAQYDEVDIAPEITHSVEAMADSLCILTKGD